MIDYPRAIAIERGTGTSVPKLVVQPLRRSPMGRLVGSRGLKELIILQLSSDVDSL